MKNKSIFLSWVPFAVTTTLIFITIYATGQQVNRQMAYDPQVQLADDGVALAQQGISPIQLAMGMPKVDLNRSMAVFAIFYGEDGHMQISTGVLGESTSTPALPKGVLDATKKMGDNRLTWQIPTGQRFAVDIRHVPSGPGGYVLVGRSLKETESRNARLLKMISLAWFFTLIVSYAGYVWKKRNSQVSVTSV